LSRIESVNERRGKIINANKCGEEVERERK